MLQVDVMLNIHCFERFKKKELSDFFILYFQYFICPKKGILHAVFPFLLTKSKIKYEKYFVDCFQKIENILLGEKKDITPIS